MISDTDIVERIESMLTRPEMYAQSPASLEDQFVLLVMGYGEEPNKLYNEYLHFTRKAGCGCATLASKFNSFAEVTEKLKLFFVTHIHNDKHTSRTEE